MLFFLTACTFNTLYRVYRTDAQKKNFECTKPISRLNLVKLWSAEILSKLEKLIVCSNFRASSHKTFSLDILSHKARYVNSFLKLLLNFFAIILFLP